MRYDDSIMSDQAKAKARVNRKRALRKALSQYREVRDWLSRNEAALGMPLVTGARRDLNRYARLVCDIKLEMEES